MIGAGLPPLDVSTAIRSWGFDGLVAGLVVVVGTLYWMSLRSIKNRNRRWPTMRTLSFFGGLIVVILATQSFIGVYDTTLFSIHVVQHVMLAMVAPLLLVAGAPVTLAIQAADRHLQVGIVSFMRSRTVTFLTRPLFAWVLYAAIMFAYYFSPIYDLSLRNDFAHEVVHVVFLFVGSLFFWSVIGVDQGPNAVSYPARILALLAAMPFHAFLGVAILSSSDILGGDFYRKLDRDWGPSLVADQQAGGVLMWVCGGIVTVAALLVIAWQWRQSDLREARRADRAIESGPL
jgi:cytochrome c oxidase assembly factor CtaG